MGEEAPGGLEKIEDLAILLVTLLKWMVGIPFSYWGGLFSGAMLVSGRVGDPFKWRIVTSNDWG